MESGTRLSINDVDLACLALDAYEDAMVRARKGNGRRKHNDEESGVAWPEPAPRKDTAHGSR